MANKFRFIEEELERREKRNQRRTLRTLTPLSGREVKIGNRRLINFCSNDYLGLSKHPLLKKRGAEFMERFGCGSTGSRLICGTFDCFDRVEKKLAQLKEAESALIFNSGYQANVSILPAFTDRKSLILSDWLSHSSIIQGALLSRCQVERFRHNDMEDLRRLLKESHSKGFSRIFIVTESVFSVDGDKSDIDALVELAEEFNAFLIVDEAHATGVLGPRGMGLACGKKVDLTISTFGKALGSFGSCVTCKGKIRDYLINCCSGFIYTTALPPPVLGFIDAALDLIPMMEQERRQLHQKADLVRRALNKLGWNTGASDTQIIPVLVGKEQETMALSSYLGKNGIFALAIRPPTVEEGKSRIRLSISALHTQEDLELLIEAFRTWRR